MDAAQVASHRLQRLPGRVEEAIAQGGGQPDAGVVGGAAADAQDNVPGPPPDGGQHQLARAQGGGVEAVALLRPEQRQPRGRGHFDEGGLPVAGEAEGSGDGPEQRVLHLRLHQPTPSMEGQDLRRPLPPVGQREKRHGNFRIRRPNPFRHRLRHLQRR